MRLPEAGDESGDESHNWLNFEFWMIINNKYWINKFLCYRNTNINWLNIIGFILSKVKYSKFGFAEF